MMNSLAGRRVPKVVDMVGHRIGLNYEIPRKETTESYVKSHERLDISNLKYSSYSLSEDKTKKKQDVPKVDRSLIPKNPLKLNARIRKRLYKLSSAERSQLTYKVMEEIHQVWVQYSQKVMGLSNDPLNIYRLDLHGCLIRCTASRNPTLVNFDGIVVQETKNTFLIIIKSDRLVTLPKRESIFEFNLGDDRYRIHGCNLLSTIQTRSKAKYKKQRFTSDV